ncbi:MAG TPA: hypothetical protein DCO89_03360 [Clostridiales bacterium]|nr:hypothetical protein [Clostridiales bacterium]
MRVLAINTSNAFGEIALKTEQEYKKIKIDNPYSENIMTALQNLLEDSNVSVVDIDAIGVVTGPGSFTGIRIGMATAKGILCGTLKKCVSINSFEILSYNIKDNNFIVLLDSGNDDCYYAIFKDKDIAEMGFEKVENIITFASKNNEKVYYSSLERDKFMEFDYLDEVKIDEKSLIELCYNKAQNNEFTSLEKLSPIYIKLSQAEIGLEKKINEGLSFREASFTDAEALSIIDEQCFSEGSERYSKKSFEGELKELSKHYIVALYNNLVIGYIGLQKLGDELNLLKIAVLPQYQKLGIGFKLMQLGFDYKTKSNLTTYFLEVKENNIKAIKLYQKFGFKTESKREKYYDDGETALVMVCR